MTHEPTSVHDYNQQRKYTFPNGFGASVVCGPYTYGGPEGLFELAVLGPDGELTYETPITNDVIGWLDEDAVQRTLDAIAALPAVGDLRVALAMPRPFVLQRDEDVSGVSGTGVVASGVEFSDGTAVLRWHSAWPTSVVFHDRGMEAIAAVHGHDGRTKVVWGDPAIAALPAQVKP